MTQKKYNAAAFIEFAITENILRFGAFTTKAGRCSPYFFNAGLFYQGASLWQLANFYAHAITDANIDYDMLFGPAYKGITLASSTACALHALGRDVSFAFNRKEAKTHGEGGQLIGAPLKGKVLIVDDVISAGTSVKEAISIIQHAGAQVAGVVVALDRMEKAGTVDHIENWTAIEALKQAGIMVYAIANLHDMLAYITQSDQVSHAQQSFDVNAIEAYQKKYCVM